MMQRYAAATGQGKALAAGEADKILAKYEDGAAVADWCKEAVAWAVKNGDLRRLQRPEPRGRHRPAPRWPRSATVFQAAPLRGERLNPNRIRGPRAARPGPGAARESLLPRGFSRAYGLSHAVAPRPSRTERAPA